jgi:Flp pilus assembly CpaF family ATPase
VRTVSLKSEAASRSIGMLRTAMGPTITGWLEDPAIVEIMLNSDGRLWIDRLSGGLSDTGKRLSAEDGERVMHLVAHHVGAETPARELVHAPFERGLASGANGNKTSSSEDWSRLSPRLLRHRDSATALLEHTVARVKPSR